MHERCLDFKDRGPVQLYKGVKTPNHARTPRSYRVVTKTKDGVEHHRRNMKNKKAAAARSDEPRQEVFGSDDSGLEEYDR